MSELTQEEQQQQYNEWVMSEMVGQLCASERFQKFIQINYDIEQIVDDSTQEVRLQVTEVSHEVAADRLRQAMTEKTGLSNEGIEVVGAGALDKLPKI